MALAACLSTMGAGPSLAASEWRFGQSWNGEWTSSLYSLNTLTTGSKVIDYHPVLVVSCKADRYPVWRQSLQIRTSVTGGEESITITARYDSAETVEETWILGQANRSFYRDGAEAVARLQRSRLFRAEWRFGFLAGRGEATFNLANVVDAVQRIADACGVPKP